MEATVVGDAPGSLLAPVWEDAVFTGVPKVHQALLTELRREVSTWRDTWLEQECPGPGA